MSLPKKEANQGGTAQRDSWLISVFKSRSSRGSPESIGRKEMLTAILKDVGRYVSPAERSARNHFRTVDTDSKIAWSTLKEEESRFVVGVFFGSTRPPRYKFYAVCKGSLVATPLEDDSAYAPKNWR